MEFTQLSELNKSEIDCYRGTGYGTVVFLKDGSEKYLKEDFIEVDKYLENL